jgi:hypothetical protein
MGALRPVLTAAALALSPVPAPAETVVWQSVGSWEVAWDADARGCIAAIVFQGGTAFFIGFDQTEVPSLEIIILDPDWTDFAPGTPHEITVSFGDESPWTAPMTGFDLDGVPGLHLSLHRDDPAADLFITEFRREGHMRWTHADTELGTFSLRGSNKAMAQTLACQAEYTTDVTATPVSNASLTTDDKAARPSRVIRPHARPNVTPTAESTLVQAETALD